MLLIGCRRSNFSLTKSGKTKSYALSCVSRTRFRRAGERRKRRGRCTNFLTSESVPVWLNAASLTGRSVPCSACLAAQYDSSDPDPPDRLFASRRQQLLYETCFCVDKADFNSSSGRHRQIFKYCIFAILETAKGPEGSRLIGGAQKKSRDFRGRRKNESPLVKFDCETWRGD